MIQAMTDLTNHQTVYINETCDETRKKVTVAYVIFQEGDHFKYCKEVLYKYRYDYEGKIFDEEVLKKCLTTSSMYLSQKEAEKALLAEQREGVKEITNLTKENVLHLFFQTWQSSLEQDIFADKKAEEMKKVIERLFEVEITTL